MSVLSRIAAVLVLCAPVSLLAQSASLPAVELFAPDVISGPANDGSPTFSPDGKMLFFTRYAAHWSVIVESHLVSGAWSEPEVAPFSGAWPDSSPAWSPDGKYVVFVSTRPKVPLKEMQKPGEAIPGLVSNLWRVDRTGAPIAPGSTFYLQKDASNTAAFYYIDVVDVEDPPAPRTQPANSISITSCGAVANKNPTNGSADPDAVDSTAAIQDCINQAQSQKRPYGYRKEPSI